MARELARLGYEVATADVGRRGARSASRNASRTWCCSTCACPSMDGLEVLGAIRATNPACDVIMLTGHGSIDTAIESIRAGAFDYIAKPCPLDELEVRIQRALERQSLRRRASLLERGLTPPDLAGSFVGESAEFRRLLQLIARVAPGDSTVLITGETGSGKEMVAKLIHARSPRRNRPFVVVECAALQESLLQSELFGHERGAFTGADRAKPGLFEVAHGGTIFLDEIGEVSPATQVKLLRVLDTLDLPPRRRHDRDPRRRARARGHESRPARHGAAGAVPRGPVLPPEHDHDRGAAAARARRRTSPCSPSTSWRR